MRTSTIRFALLCLFAGGNAFAFDPGATVGNILTNNINNIPRGGGAGGSASPSGWEEFSDHGMNGDGVGGPTCAPVPTQPSMDVPHCLYLDKLYSTVVAECNKPLFEGPFAGLPACAPGRHPYSSYYDATRGGNSHKEGEKTGAAAAVPVKLAVSVLPSSRAECVSMLATQKEVANSIDGNPDPAVVCKGVFTLEEAMHQKFEIVQKEEFLFTDREDCERRVDIARKGTHYVKQKKDGVLEDIPETAEFCLELFPDASTSVPKAPKAPHVFDEHSVNGTSFGEVRGAEINFVPSSEREER